MVATTSKQPGRIAYSNSTVRQGSHEFYTLTMESDVLFRTSFVSHRHEDPESGFQRWLDKKRALEIAKYIEDGGTIPNAIVLSAQREADVKIKTRKSLEFNDVPRAFMILDGQHRVFAFGLSKTIMRIPVVIYKGLTLVQETKIFMDINTKQRPVPNELLLDIRKLAETESEPDQYLREIFDYFNNQPDSPLLGLMSPSEKAVKKISRVTFNGALRPLLPIFEHRTAFEAYEPLAAFLAAFVQGLTLLGLSELITNPILIRAIFATFEVTARRVRDRNEVYESEHFFTVLEPLFQPGNKANFINPSKSPLELTLKFKKILDAKFRI